MDLYTFDELKKKKGFTGITFDYETGIDVWAVVAIFGEYDARWAVSMVAKTPGEGLDMIWEKVKNYEDE